SDRRFRARTAQEGDGQRHAHAAAERPPQGQGGRHDARGSHAGDGEVMTTLMELLKTLVDRKGSDLHITTDSPPQVRIHGHLERLPLPTLNPAETKQVVYSVLTDAQKKRFEET